MDEDVTRQEFYGTPAELTISLLALFGAPLSSGGL